MNKYLLFGMLFSVILIAGCSDFSDGSDVEWRCSVLNCSSQIEMTGLQWAQRNCQVTENGTICSLTLENGQQGLIPLEQLNLSAIKATQCLEYTCLEEVPFRKAEYKLNITN